MRVTAENLVTALFRASPDRVEILDPDGRLLDMNPHGRDLMEIDDFTATRGRLWTTFWATADRDRVTAALAGARLGRADVFEADGATAGGSPKRWEVSVLPILDGVGDVARILATSHEVVRPPAREATSGRVEGERRRVEDAWPQISHTEKLRVLGRFVGTVVHDINNVLASMAGAARLLRRQATDARTLDILDHVDRAVERGAALVRRLLDFSRTGDGDPEVIDLAAALAADGELMRHLVGRSIEVTIDVEDGVWPVSIAPGRLQSVLFNLVANARDALGEGPGHVRVEVRNRAGGGTALDRSPGDRVEISVSDDGPGMPPEVVARLGEPFFTTKEAGKGTGLGVPSAFDLAERAGGHVEIDSGIGRGTRIALLLPSAEPARRG